MKSNIKYIIVTLIIIISLITTIGVYEGWGAISFRSESSFFQDLLNDPFETIPAFIFLFVLILPLISAIVIVLRLVTRKILSKNLR